MGLLGFFKRVAVIVSDSFQRIFGKEVAQKFGEASLEMLKTAEGVIVQDVVTLIEAAHSDLSGSQKAALALENLKADARIQAKGLETGIIKLLIELAFRKLIARSFVARAS